MWRQHALLWTVAPCRIYQSIEPVETSLLQYVWMQQILVNCRAMQQWLLNLLNPTGHVMHHQFNIQQLYVLPTLYLCVLYLSENKQRLVPLTA
jgi:hypothetical protein